MLRYKTPYIANKYFGIKEYGVFWIKWTKHINSFYYQDTIMAQSLKIVAWNANGLSQHMKKVKMFMLNNNVDTMLISETLYQKT